VKSAVVTGATSGIGRATAVALSAEGYWVLACGQDPGRGRDVESRLKDAGQGAFLAADLGAQGSAETIIERVRSETGRLDVLVNNAGIHFLATIDQTDPDRMEELLGINLHAAMLLCRAAIPLMRESGGGVVINVSSEAGLVAVPGQVAYNVSKAALIMLTKSIAVDHANDGIRAVSVCPGTTRTPLVEAAIASAPNPAEHESWLSSSRPAGRLGEEAEIARAIVFAASNEVAYMTGTEIVIDGGYTAV
jgi:NAD(P)-dependent dehydrogenase (short-subunit alcohol dehydrogenase family)